MKTAIFSFQHCFYKCKIKKVKTPLDLNWIEMTWSQDGAVATSLTCFSINVSPTDGRKWGMKLLETFVLFMSKPSAVSPESLLLSQLSLLICSLWKEWKRTALFWLFPTIVLGKYFNATAGNNTEVLVGNEQNSSEHTGVQGSHSTECKDLPFKSIR